MNRIAGLIMIGFSLLTTALIFMLARLSSKADEIDGNFGGWFGQIPPIIYIFIIIPLLIGVALLNTRNTDK